MKQVININFHGQVVPIEVSAFDLLKNYTDSLSKHFEAEEGKEEIINDIESRIGELFQERLKKGVTCITDDDVNAIIKSMGRPEEFDSEEDRTANNTSTAPGNNSSEKTDGAIPLHKKLYRDENNKVLGGVCSGVANYFGTDPMIIRLIFVAVALAFGTGILAYIIMWIAVPSSSIKEIGGQRKKLFRDPDDKIIGGVGSGLGNYFGINPWIPRVLFLLPFLSFVFHWNNFGFGDFPDFFNFSFSPGALIAYIIFWLVIPEAANTAEKLEMKGEKVDMNSIKNSVVEEMKGVQQRAEKFGKEVGAVAGEKGKVMGTEIKSAAKRGSRSLGDVIVLIVKVFAYFIIGCVSFVLVIALFTIAVVSIGVFPLKAFVLTDGWQNAMAWGTLLFFIAVPVIGIITWIIRRLAKMKSNRKVLRFTFISLWIIGWACFTCLVASISKDFKSVNNINEQEVLLLNPAVNKLELTTNNALKNSYRYNSFKLEPFEGWDEDTVFVKNVSIKIVKSTNDSFRVTLLKMANGKTKRFADTLANLIEYNAVQKDSLLVLDKGISINRKDKFRNQRVVITVYVPVGKQIRIDRSVGRGNNNVRFEGPWNNNDDFYIDRDDEETDWESNVDYIMNADGLYTLDGIPAGKYDSNNRKRVRIGPGGIEVRDGNKKVTIDENGVNIDEGKDNYRYNNDGTINRLDSLQMIKEMEQQRIKDSLQKVKENIEKQLEKIDDKKSDPEAMNYNRFMLISPVLGFM